MRANVWRAAGVLLLTVSSTQVWAPFSAMAVPGDRSAMSLAVFGDAPYGTSPTDHREFDATPGFINAINTDPDVESVVHVGDIHSGKQYCTEGYNRSVASLWTHFQDALVYTPGDNEWADCNKKSEGGGMYNSSTGRIDYVTNANDQPVDYASGDPVANLDLVRSIFFADPGGTLGSGDLQVQSQARHADPAHPEDSAYVENVMWQRKGVLFVTVNIPGGSNNDNDAWYKTPEASSRQSHEVARRTAADLRWLDAAFSRAQEDSARAVVIVTQADMCDLDGKPASHLTQYEPFVSSIAEQTTSFAKPVLMLNGDSHVYRSDNPYSATGACVTEAAADGSDTPCDPTLEAQEAGTHPGYNVPNFHRIVVHGSTLPLEWLKLTIDPRSGASGLNSFGPFSWSRNRVTD